MDRDGKGANPREHSKLCNLGERVQARYKNQSIPYGFQDASRRQGSESPGT